MAKKKKRTSKKKGPKKVIPAPKVRIARNEWKGTPYERGPRMAMIQQKIEGTLDPNVPGEFFSSAVPAEIRLGLTLIATPKQDIK